MTITLRSGGAATVYTDAVGAGTRVQPLTTDVAGRATGWLDRGSYLLDIAVPGRPTREEYFDSSPGEDGSIDGAWISVGAISTTKLADDSVTDTKLADKAVTEPKLADESVSTDKLSDVGVTTAKIADAAITTPKLADGSVTVAKLTSGISAGNRTLLLKNVPHFTLGGSNLRSYIYPYYYPYYGSTFYRDYYYLSGGNVDQSETLTNISDKVTVAVWLGGTTASYNGYIGIKVILDGVPVLDLVDERVDHGPYSWYYWYWYYGQYDSLNCAKTLTVAPGTHTWNVRITYSNYYSYYNTFSSGGSTLMEIREEPSV